MVSPVCPFPGAQQFHEVAEGPAERHAVQAPGHAELPGIGQARQLPVVADRRGGPGIPALLLPGGEIRHVDDGQFPHAGRLEPRHLHRKEATAVKAHQVHRARGQPWRRFQGLEHGYREFLHRQHFPRGVRTAEPRTVRRANHAPVAQKRRNRLEKRAAVRKGVQADQGNAVRLSARFQQPQVNLPKPRVCVRASHHTPPVTPVCRAGGRDQSLRRTGA